jgi:hypothetical protein
MPKYDKYVFLQIMNIAYTFNFYVMNAAMTDLADVEGFAFPGDQVLAPSGAIPALERI